MARVIVVGGGLAGLSTAHTVLEQGGNVIVIDKSSFLGGNSTKATSGINGALTKTQIAKGIQDSAEAFLKDTVLSAHKGDPNGKVYPLAQVLTGESAPAVEWLIEKFGLDLSLVSRLGGHSFPRTHRGKERFPGMTITYALMERLEQISASNPDRAQIVTKARVTKLLTTPEGAVTGVEYIKDGQTFTESGPVVLATGGYGADFTADSLLGKYRPDLLNLPTTNGDHCTGDGIKMTLAIGGGVVDMERVQVHPTGLVHPDEPDAKLKFLAAEALRGVGGLLLDAEGNRFCNELGRRDYVSDQMMKGKGPYRLVLNGASAKEIEWHCKHYVGRGLMKRFNNGSEVARELGIPEAHLRETFRKYNEVAKAGTDQYEKKFFQNVPYEFDDVYHVAIVVPIVHYCMGGVRTSALGEIQRDDESPIPGLYAAGEVSGGVHGANRLGGSSLLDCVVFGRVSGRSVSAYLFQQTLRAAATGRISNVLGHLTGENVSTTTINQGGVQTTIQIAPNQNQVALNFSWNQGAAPQAASHQAPQAAAQAAPAAAAPAPTASYTLDDVAKHATEKDCWVVVNDQVLDVTKFLPDHPGGKKAILLFAGKDASAEFNMLHKPDVVAKYAPDSIIGNLKQ